MKKANYLSVLGENRSLKESINFINSFVFFNNCLIIRYKLAIKRVYFQSKVGIEIFIKESNSRIY